MKHKDMPTWPILAFLWIHRRDPVTQKDTDNDFDCPDGLAPMPTLATVFPVMASERDRLRKLKALSRAGLVKGCDCGACYGGWQITPKGVTVLEALEAEQAAARG